jgi:hypothetical protein
MGMLYIEGTLSATDARQDQTQTEHPRAEESRKLPKPNARAWKKQNADQSESFPFVFFGLSLSAPRVGCCYPRLVFAGLAGTFFWVHDESHGRTSRLFLLFFSRVSLVSVSYLTGPRGAQSDALAPSKRTARPLIAGVRRKVSGAKSQKRKKGNISGWASSPVPRNGVAFIRMRVSPADL